MPFGAFTSRNYFKPILITVIYRCSDLMEVIAWLLHPRPESRGKIQDMDQDPWVQQPIDISLYEWEEVLPNCGKF